LPALHIEQRFFDGPVLKSATRFLAAEIPPASFESMSANAECFLRLGFRRIRGFLF
jgi:hypothetical protein